MGHGAWRNNFELRNANCEFNNKKSGARIQNSGEKNEKSNSSLLVADDYWILLLRIAKLGTRPKGGSPTDNFTLQQITA
jgi:hypothetical protein